MVLSFFFAIFSRLFMKATSLKGEKMEKMVAVAIAVVWIGSFGYLGYFTMRKLAERQNAKDAYQRYCMTHPNNLDDFLKRKF